MQFRIEGKVQHSVTYIPVNILTGSVSDVKLLYTNNTSSNKEFMNWTSSL